MAMKYGQIAGNNNINAMIYHCFEYICKEDEQRFMKKFQEQSHDSDQLMHTFRELVLGAYLSSKGFRMRYDHAIDNQTPDWIILDVEGVSTIGIVELTNFHIDKVTENEIEEQLHDAKDIVHAKDIAYYWRDQNKDNVERLYYVIQGKLPVYRSLIKKLQVPYIVGVFGEFKAAVDFEEVSLCLFDEETGLFGMYPELSGVLYFEDSFGRYSFNYASNPNALQMIELPIDIFPSRLPNSHL